VRYNNDLYVLLYYVSGDVGTSADECLRTPSGQPQKGAVWSHCYSANGGTEWDMHK